MAYRTRKEVRKALGQAIATDLAGTNLPLADFSTYHKGDFEGASPVGTISSGGGEPVPFTTLGSKDRYYYLVSMLVIRPIQEELTSYSEEDAEDALDDAYDEFRQWVENNRRDNSGEGMWNWVEIEGRSTITPVTDAGGRGYFMETIPISVEVF